MRASRCFAVLAATLLAAACGKAQQDQPPPPPQVGVITVHPGPIPLTRDLVGRLSATRVSDVRARVPGILLKRLYKEGTEVREGQPLFQIDPAPLQTALDAALAAQAQAQATATNAHIAAARARELIPSGLVSRSDLDNAEATERSSAAAVQQAKANVESARINLGYARVTAPISGRAGQQGVTEGALVGQGTATLLTTVEQLDPIYVNFDQPAIEVERLRREQSSGDISLVEPHKAVVQLTLPDGTAYGTSGLLDFSDVAVNPTTGAVALRGTVPNPDKQLLPGMYVNVRLTVGTLNHAFLIPQAALLRDAKGPYVLTVGTDSKVIQKRVTADTTNGQNWIVPKGLDDGDRVIVSGTQSARPDSLVNAVPYSSADGSSAAASR
ncbi:MAG TPA: efflux RND transporter periplasmic adaptor subunit [Steroidobacteraceae bacterium]|jgi:membrane fusion protein (multidrug efflux system)|nr:efflux RND transporter periplasmic adaptor subunit [Steroidobacteraceae bacterium]